MKKLFCKNDKGFTMVEMMIVLLVITVILLVAIPNVTKHSKAINEKGCEAFIRMVQGQAEAYFINEKEYPDMKELSEFMDIKEGELTCPNGNVLIINDEGVVGSSKDGEGV